jgi:hypothetical protein
MQNPIIKAMQDYVDRFGHAPGIDVIEALGNFREAGGLTRILTALQSVAETYRLAKIAPAAPESVVRNIIAKHGFDDGEGMMVVMTEAELRAALK